MKVSNYEQLIDYMKAKRKERKITQSDLANHLNTSTQTILNYEKSKCDMPLSKVIDYAELLDLSIEIS